MRRIRKLSPSTRLMKGNRRHARRFLLKELTKRKRGHYLEYMGDLAKKYGYPLHAMRSAISRAGVICLRDEFKKKPILIVRLNPSAARFSPEELARMSEDDATALCIVPMAHPLDYVYIGVGEPNAHLYTAKERVRCVSVVRRAFERMEAAAATGLLDRSLKDALSQLGVILTAKAKLTMPSALEEKSA